MFVQKRPHILIFALLIVALLASACASAVPSYEEKSAGGYSTAPMGGEAAPVAPSEDLAYGNKVQQSEAQQIQRLVIKNASLSIAVDDPSASMDRISGMAEDMNGYVVTANMYQTFVGEGVKVPQGSITIRVPAERLQEALTQIKAETTLPVINETISSQDVTSEYTDLASQVRNLEAAEAQLQKILDQANKTEDVLNVFNELTRVRGEIEVLKGQMKYYEQSAALSAVSVELVPNAAVQPVTIGGWQPQGIARDALQALIDTLKWLATAGIWLVLYFLPTVLIIFGPPILILWGIIRWVRRRKKVRPAA